jgi:hypothetical protein
MWIYINIDILKFRNIARGYQLISIIFGPEATANSLFLPVFLFSVAFGHVTIWSKIRSYFDAFIPGRLKLICCRSADRYASALCRRLCALWTLALPLHPPRHKVEVHYSTSASVCSNERRRPTRPPTRWTILLHTL